VRVAQMRQFDAVEKRRMSESSRIGFVGLGIMGRPMAHNLLRAGYHLVVHDLVRSAADELQAEGADRADTPRDVAARCDVLITMLPDSADVEDVYLGSDGALAGARPGWLAVDMSSIAPRVARDLATRAADQGADMLDAPVSGGDKGAIAGTLSIMVGGSPDAFARAEPILRVMGQTVVHVGPSGAGQVVKVCNQVVVATVIEAVSEALVLGAKAGVDPARIVEVLQGGLAATRVLELRGDNILRGKYDPGFRVRLHLKDLRNALELARETGVVLPVAAEVEQLMQRLRVAGGGDMDHSALVTVLEELARRSRHRACKPRHRRARDSPEPARAIPLASRDGL
jgi:2-hydroxy-3-oxopropionate reductase